MTVQLQGRSHLWTPQCKHGKLGVRTLNDRVGLVVPKWGAYLTGGGDPFPYASPLSTFDGLSGTDANGMLGNDYWGDCVFAGYVHTRQLQAWLAGVQPVGNWDDTKVWPTADQVLTAYLLYNGSPDPEDHDPSGPNAAYDNGADPDEALLWFMDNGIGPMSPLGPDGAFADVDDFGEELEGAVANFGVLWNAILVSDEAMQQFDAGLPFTSTSTNWDGGHLFPWAYRDPKQGKGSTWGVEWEFDWPWWRTARELSRVILSPEILAALKFFDVTKLKADVQALKTAHGILAGKPAPSAAQFAPRPTPSAIASAPQGWFGEVETEAEKLAGEAETDIVRWWEEGEAEVKRVVQEVEHVVHHDVNDPVKLDDRGRPAGVPYGD